MLMNKEVKRIVWHASHPHPHPPSPPTSPSLQPLAMHLPTTLQLHLLSLEKFTFVLCHKSLILIISFAKCSSLHILLCLILLKITCHFKANAVYILSLYYCRPIIHSVIFLFFLYNSGSILLHDVWSIVFKHSLLVLEVN